MTIDTLLADPRPLISKDEQNIYLELFEWILKDLDNYKEIDTIKIKDRLFLSISFKGKYKAKNFPLFSSIFSILAPKLLDIFRRTLAANNVYHVKSATLTNLICNPEDLYEHYFMYGFLPTEMLIELYNFIRENTIGEPIKEVEKNYASVASIST